MRSLLGILFVCLTAQALPAQPAAQPAAPLAAQPLPAPPGERIQPTPLDASLSGQGEAFGEFSPLSGPCPDCHGAECEPGGCWTHGDPGTFRMLCGDFCDFVGRSTATHGRAVGLGGPLRGTSWLNRPYEISMEFGALLMANRPSPGVRSSNDLYAAIQAGWDWDHYWGSQLRVGWATPRMEVPRVSGDESDNFFITDASLLYYPWGDSKMRPYWRVGMGLTELEFTNANGARQQEFLYTMPFGIGVKHQMLRWLVWRAEIVDNLAFGANEADTMNNFTLTLGVEGRFGGRPTGYWAWRPRGYAW